MQDNIGQSWDFSGGNSHFLSPQLKKGEKIEVEIQELQEHKGYLWNTPDEEDKSSS